MAAVEVVDERHRGLVDVGQELLGQLGQAHLRVAHRGGVVAVDGAKVALALHERVAHVEVLGHAHQGIVDRGVAVRVVLAEHLADHGGALAEGDVMAQAEAEHAVEHTTVHRLEPVTHVGERAAHDHAHGVIEIGRAHLIV